MPCHDRPAAWRLYPVDPASLYVEHFPLVGPQLPLNPDSKPAARLLTLGKHFLKQRVPLIPGVVPGLEVVTQRSGQLGHVDGRPARLPDSH